MDGREQEKAMSLLLRLFAWFIQSAVHSWETDECVCVCHCLFVRLFSAEACTFAQKKKEKQPMPFTAVLRHDRSFVRFERRSSSAATGIISHGTKATDICFTSVLSMTTD